MSYAMESEEKKIEFAKMLAASILKVFHNVSLRKAIDNLHWVGEEDFKNYWIPLASRILEEQDQRHKAKLERVFGGLDNLSISDLKQDQD